MRASVFLPAILALHLSAAEKPVLVQEQTITLAGVSGQLGHLCLDEKNQILFVAAPENNTIELANLALGKRVASIKALARPTAVLFLPQANRVLVSNGDDGTVKILEANSDKLVRTLYSILEPEHLALEPNSGQVWVGYGSGTLGILDQPLSTIERTFKMPGHPQAFQFETNGARVFVNVPSAKTVAVFDRDKRKLLESWTLENFEQNYPMALNEENARLFIGCRKPPALVVLDTTSGKVVAKVPIARDTDDLFYDCKRRRIYISCGEGFIDCVQQTSPDRYERIATLDSAEGARNGVFSAALDRFYLGVPSAGPGRTAEVRVYRPE